MMQSRKVETTKIGGVINVSTLGTGITKLYSSRYGCEGCRKRTLEFFQFVAGVSSVEFSEDFELTLSYDSKVIDVRQLAEVAQKALQADPHNPASVSLVFADNLKKDSSHLPSLEV